ncbi:Hypothetical predicted protein [Octopus vulgaris]|uniref:Uncharacterized protein n=1 Tax=Octopus vulgaris TaxID=6645 RepID=A0AA36F7B4_OCTVU|nr:Hypothetical predicted protein [Octopus vulgaris]
MGIGRGSVADGCGVDDTVCRSDGGDNVFLTNCQTSRKENKIFIDRKRHEREEEEEEEEEKKCCNKDKEMLK